MRNLAFNGLRLPRLGAMRGIATALSLIPAGALNNVRLTGLGDSRIARPTLMPNLLGRTLNINQVVGEDNFGVGGQTIRQLNGLDSASDTVASVLAYDAAVCVVLLGVNSTQDFTLTQLQQQMTAILTRLDSVPVVISSASGTFARDTTGTRADIGDAVDEDTGATIVAVNAGGTIAWIRGATSLSSGDTITGANSGWTATLDADPAALSGRVFFVVSEYPANPRGPVHKSYADWLDTAPYGDFAHSYFRTVKAMDALAVSPAADPDNPLQFIAAYLEADDSGLHLNEPGARVSASTIGPQIDALMADYPSQYPAYTVPAGVAAVDVSGANVPPTGATTPAGWSITDVTTEPGGFVEMEGTDGDADRVISFGIENAAYAGASNCFIRSFLQNPLVVPAGGRSYRYGLEFKVTNRAGDGPPVGFASFRPQMIFADGTFVQPTIAGDDISDWSGLVTQDKPLAAAVSGRFTFQPRIYITTGGAVDFAVRMRRIGIWEITV
jgi:hypothetical protein